MLLSGGEHQIARADGDVPLQASITATPGWKRALGQCLDALMVNTAPDVPAAIRWNTPFYGVKGKGWFLSFHCFTRYIKVAFHNGAALQPIPSVESKQARIRYLHIHEGEELDEQRMSEWIRQAANLPGDELF